MEEEITIITNVGKRVVVNDENETNTSYSIYDEIPILVEKDFVMNSIEIFKSALMITIEKLNTMIDFLKNELEEKNLHIRTLLLRDANDGRSIDITLLNRTTQSSMETTPPIPDENNFHDEIMVEFNSSQMYEQFEDNCQSIHSIISSISEESVISMERDSSNDESNYSSNVNSNYSASEQLIVIDEFDDSDTNNNNDYDNKSLYSTWDSYPTIIDSLNETFVQHTTRKYELQPAKFCNNANDYINDDLQNLNDINDVYKKELDECALWRRGTTLIVGDSLIYGLDESRLKNCKVRVFPGASIEDMYYNIVPLIRKKPTTIILHAGANNCVNDNSNQIIKKLLRLKGFILRKLPYCTVTFSSLIYRFDEPKAQLTTLMTNKNLMNLGEDVIDNSNIETKHLGRKGLHMNSYGTSRLAMNIIRFLKKL